MLWLPDAKSQLIVRDPYAGKDWCWEKWGDRGWDGWMASPTQWTWVWVNSGSWWWTGRPWRAAVYGVTNSRMWFSDWTTAEFTETAEMMKEVSSYSVWTSAPRPKDDSSIPWFSSDGTYCVPDTAARFRLTEAVKWSSPVSSWGCYTYTVILFLLFLLSSEDFVCFCF